MARVRLAELFAKDRGHDPGYLDKPILPALGALQASRITTADLDRFYRDLLVPGGHGGPYAPATIRRIHGIVRRALTQGVRWGWLSHNPAVDASPPRVRARLLTPPSPEEVVRLLQFAEARDPDLGAFVWLAAATGAGRGEFVAMRRSDVDLTSATVTVERGIVIARRELVEQGTKTHQSRRVALDTSTCLTTCSPNAVSVQVSQLQLVTTTRRRSRIPRVDV